VAPGPLVEFVLSTPTSLSNKPRFGNPEDLGALASGVYGNRRLIHLFDPEVPLWKESLIEAAISGRRMEALRQPVGT
jgi:hypothetical protein